MAVREIVSPLIPEVSRSLKAGDMVNLSGRIVTARDQVHRYLAAGGKPPVDLEGLVIYHCGPVVIRKGGSWQVLAAGPTTSIREEPYEAGIIRSYHPVAVMGKGGMGAKTAEALQTEGCVYLHLTGGAASSIAGSIECVEGVHLLEFGQPEALWIFHVRSLSALVTMDSYGNSLHRDIESSSLEVFRQLLKTPFREEKS